VYVQFTKFLENASFLMNYTVMFVFLCLHITAEKLKTTMETFIRGNKGQGLKVRASLSSLCFLRNRERIIRVMNCDREAPDIYIRMCKCGST
jgi:hypothetical protein